jgi:hypothetical protein
MDTRLDDFLELLADEVVVAAEKVYAEILAEEGVLV